MSGSAWRVTLLGGVRLACGDREITRFESRKVVALLARLVLSPSRRQTREELAALLWPDAERRVGLERLRHVLSSLQRQIALPGDAYVPPLLAADRLGVRLQADTVDSDVRLFEVQIRQKNWQEAVRLYAGDLLPGHYDDWIQEERERLRALYEIAAESCPEPGDAAEELLPVSAAPVSDAARRVFLPPYLTAFFGREEEQARLGELLQKRRLVTLLGPGGCGKTRLAVEVCRGKAAVFHTVLFVPLTDCYAPEQIPDRVRAALQLPQGESPLEQVSVTLGEASALLVLDNMEQMEPEAAAEVVASLLERVPGMHCLLTSRTLLQMAGEQVFPLQPLPLPVLTPEAEPPGIAAAQNPCLQLFIDRARLSRPDFAVTPNNRRDLFALCRVLEGIPLALELCASRIRGHSPGEMRLQVESGKRFALVARSDGARQKSGRHSSLHAAIRWSWNLLPARLQDTMAALSLLHGRFRAETVSLLCGVADSRLLLEELANASLLQMQTESLPEGEVTFFFLLESVRQFASEHLAPSRRQALRHSHTAFLLTLAANPQTALSMAWEDTLYLQGAVEEAISDGAGNEALALCTSLREVWYSTGRTSTALALLQRALALPPGPGPSDTGTRTEALAFGVYLAITGADFALASRFAEEAETAAGDTPETLAVWQAALAFLRYRGNEPSAAIRSLAAEGRVNARLAERRDLLASLETTLGMLANREKKFVEAESHLREAEALWESRGDAQRASLVRFKRAVIASDQGDVVRARRCYEECLSAARRVNDQKTEASIYGNLGLLLTQEGRWSEAIRAIQEGIRRSYSLGNVLSVHIGLWNLAEPLVLLNRGAEAVTVFAWGRKFWEAGGVSLTDEDRAHCDYIFRKAAASLPGGSADLSRHDTRGRAFSVREAVDFALGV